MSAPALRLLGPGLLVGAAAVLALAVWSGGATLYLVGFIPVLTGSSPLLLIGILLLFLGILFLPLAFFDLESDDEEEPGPTGGVGPSAAPPSSGRSGAGGVVLVGPFPIFFGAYRHPSRSIYWIAVLVGTIALALAVYVAFAFR